VGIRLSPTGTFNDIHERYPLEAYGYYLDEIADYNLGYVHFVERFPGIVANQSELNILQQLRKKVSCLYIANGDYDKNSANQAVASYYADAVSLGRKFIANPDLVTRFALDAMLNEPDYATFYGGNEKGYTDYPLLEYKKLKVA
jgi:N-ethylmaleimide reductase